jgi:hypothetical protein
LHPLVGLTLWGRTMYAYAGFGPSNRRMSILPQSLRYILCIFDNCSQPLYAGIEMIHMPHVHSNISIAQLGVTNSQFYRFLRLCSCKEFLVSQMVSRILLLKIQGHPLRILLKRSRGLLNKKKWKPTWSLFFSALLFCVLSILLYFSVFCYLLVLLLVSSQWHG